QTSGRLWLDFTPGDDLDIALKVEFGRKEGNDHRIKFRNLDACNPDNTSGTQYYLCTAPGGIPLNDVFPSPADGAREVKLDLIPFEGITQRMATAIVGYKLGTGRIEAVTGYASIDYFFHDDDDGSMGDFSQVMLTDDETWVSQELRYVSADDQRF